MGTIGHSAGILCANYCPHDASLAMTITKDKGTSMIQLWAVGTLELVAEVPSVTTNTHVQWSPHQQGVVLTYGFNKPYRFMVYSLDAVVNLQ